MARAVRRHPDFLADVREQVRWIEAHRDEAWIVRLQEALDEAIRALTRFPAMGVAVSKREDPLRGSLRKLVLRRVPFVLWYRVAGAEVWILRLFHARQKGPLAPRPRGRARRR